MRYIITVDELIRLANEAGIFTKRWPELVGKKCSTSLTAYRDDTPSFITVETEDE